MSSHRPLAVLLAAGTALSFALGAALVTSVISAAPASAHAVLVKITPAAGAHLTAAPKQVVVELNEPVGSTFTTVAVTDAAGLNVSRGKPTVLGGKVTQPLDADLPSGEYRIAYRVTSDDGHPVTGQSRFTLKLAPGARPATSATAPPAKETDAGRQGSTVRLLLVFTGALGLLVVVAGALVRRGRRAEP